MCIWLKAEIRSHVAILLAALLLSDSIAVIIPGICLPIALYRSIKDFQTICMLEYMITNYIPIIFHSFSILVTTIVAVQRLCICVFPFKALFLFTMRNTVIAMVVTFLICVIMTLSYLMINNVMADIAMSTNNASIAYININNVLSEVFVSAYISDYFPYFRLFGLQILPMCIVLFTMVYCFLTVTRPTSSGSDERTFTEYSTLNNCYDL
jgi:hypothetical protein